MNMDYEGQVASYFSGDTNLSQLVWTSSSLAGLRVQEVMGSCIWQLPCLAQSSVTTVGV